MRVDTLGVCVCVCVGRRVFIRERVARTLFFQPTISIRPSGAPFPPATPTFLVIYTYGCNGTGPPRESGQFGRGPGSQADRL